MMGSVTATLPQTNSPKKTSLQAGGMGAIICMDIPWMEMPLQAVARGKEGGIASAIDQGQRFPI